jgi:uncharacterized protein (TIGR03435 family)
VGGPSWLDSDRFDVIAKAAASVPQTALRTMLQGLLEERFQLAVQREDKPQPVFALVLANRGSPKESAGTGEADCQAGNEENVRTYACHHVSMANLAERLPLAAPAYFNKPVVDRTGLKGVYDFTLRWLPRAQLPPGSDGNALSAYNSIEKQLGVKVENQTAPMPVLTITKVTRTPIDNPPGAVEKLGPAPTEFEVADIKKSRPDEPQDATMNGGRLEARGLSLKDLIEFAYNVEDDWVKGGEKWLDSERYNIIAKTAPTASFDTLRAMLQNLLAERFHLKVHTEPQAVTVYALTVGRSKLKDADPSSRSTCKAAAENGARTYTCQNTTMAQFAEKIRSVASGYLDHPVVDLTGLKGGYDFSLSYAPRARLQGGGERAATAGDAAAAGGAVPAATDRPVGYTLFEAVERQLGLKLAAQKHPMPVIVVDHCDRTPTEN